MICFERESLSDSARPENALELERMLPDQIVSPDRPAQAREHKGGCHCIRPN